MRGAFETKRKTQSDYNAFVAANAAANNVWLTKQQVDAGNCVVAPYVISRGSLGEIRQQSSATMITSNLYIGNLTISAQTTIGQLSTALIANNNGLLDGDQLSVIQYIQNTSTTGAYSVVCRPYELILNSTSTSPLSNYLPVSILASSGGDTPTLAIVTTGFVGGASFVLSRTQGGRVLVSTSSVSLTNNNVVYSIMTTAAQKQSAITSYGTSTVVFLDSGAASGANESVTTAISILSIRIGNNTYSPGTMLPERIGETETITINLSGAVTDAENIGMRLVNSPTGDVWNLGNDDTHGQNPTQTLTTEIGEEADMREGETWRLILFRGEDAANVITYAEFLAYSSSGEGLG